MSKYEIMGTLELALANYRAVFESTDHVLAWDNGLAVKGDQAVGVWNAEAVEPTDTRRWLNGMNERASVKLRRDVAMTEYKRTLGHLARLVDLWKGT